MEIGDENSVNATREMGKESDRMLPWPQHKKPEPTELLEDQERDGKMKSTTSSDLARQRRQEATIRETMTHESK